MAIQLVPISRTNPPVETEIAAPANVQAILTRSCYDCHSNKTAWPWYSHVAPVSWLVASDVSGARKKMNFTPWNAYSIHQQAWPEWDESLAAAETFTLVVQVNGKLRDRFDVPVDIGETEAKEMALASPRVLTQIEGHEIQRVLFVPGRLVNIVVR